MDEDNKCIWVSLMEAKTMKFKESSAFNYCAWSSCARAIQYGQTMPWPWAGIR